MATGAELVGTSILHYHIIERLGAGGMGEVYLAEDTRLGRRAALKFLTATGTPDAEARARLVTEARAASVLRSPHIAVTYDLVEHGDALFIAMEHVEGETVAARLARGPLAVREALDVALQVADALDEAHERGIIHRDIKSANLIVTGRGLVKVLDFGLAKFLPRMPEALQTMRQVTLQGAVLGTLHYMAPEQLRGADVDHRADLFALGVVLYEMLTGRLPFGGASFVDLADRVLNHAPDPMVRHDDGVPADVQAIVLRALEKEPDARYRSARQFYRDLKDARQRLDAGAGVRSAGHRSAPAAIAGSPEATGARRRALAVLAFTNMTGEAADDWIGQGMAETLTADLKKVRHLWVISREQIFDQLRRLPGQLDERQTIEMGRRLGASWVVAGAYQRIGDRLRITARVIDLATGAPAGSMRVDGRVDELFDLQDRLVLDIAASLELQLAESEIGTIVGGDTRSIHAYQAYSLGMLNLRMASRESIERAVALFERAIGLDPDYAEAVAGLGAAYQLKAEFLSIGDLNARSLALLRRALALKPSLADVQVRLAGGLQMDGDVDGALAILHDAVRAQPESAVAQAALGRLYWTGKGMIPEAVAFLETAAALNPESGYTHLQLALLYALTGRLDEAEQAARTAVNLQELAMSGTQGLLIVGAHTRLGYVHYRRGHYDEAIGEYRRELEFLGASDHALRERTQIELHQKLSAAFHRKGDEASARTYADHAVAQFHQRVAAGADDPSTRYYLGALFALQGDAAAALSHLQYPLRVLGPLTRWRLASDPDFDPVRDALASSLA